MGSVSGSVVSNVLTTGVVTIPAMKRTGFSPAYAGGVEACASTGGVLMPPIMGATAFVMASFLGIPYSTVVLAALVPSLLFYFGLFVQIDGYAARKRACAACRAPSCRRSARTFAEGWQYIFVFVLLVWMLLVLQQEAHRAVLRHRAAAGHQPGLAAPPARAGSASSTLLEGVSKSLAELAALLAGVGPDHRLAVGHRPGRHAGQRPGLPGRQQHLRAAGDGRAHQLHLRHGHDDHRLLHLPGHRAGAAAGGRRLRPGGGAPVHDVLGHGVVHHAAGGAGLLRRRRHRRRARR